MTLFLKNDPKISYKIKLVSLVFIAFLSSLFLTYLAIQDSIDYRKKEMNQILDTIEESAIAKILNSKGAIYQLALSLIQESITADNQRIHDIISNFKVKPGYEMSLPMSSTTLLGTSDKVITTNLEASNIHKAIHLESFPRCKQLASKTAFELKVIPILRGENSKKLVLPLIMKVDNLNKQHVATICSGLLVDKFNELLEARYGAILYANKINLVNKQDYNLSDEDMNRKVNEVFSTKYMVKSYFKEEKLLLYRGLNGYPIAIEILLNDDFFSYKIRLKPVYYISLFLILFLISYFIWLVNKNYHTTSLLYVSRKFSLLNSDVNKINEDLISEFCPVRLANNVNDLIQYVSTLKQDENNLKELEMRKKLLNLVLTERHFLPYNRTAFTSEEKLYLNKLESLANEEYISMNLVDFINQITEYCCEFYYDMQVKVIIQEQDQRSFRFKHAALTETIFHIFTFISRIGLAQEDNIIILKGGFISVSDLPIITIEVDISNNSLVSLGWLSGPPYVYNSLLSIYMLAKENELFFNIDKKNNKMILILEPMFANDIKEPIDSIIK
jgi:hypothetical protein